MTIQRALISVSDKTGLVDFAKGLVDLGIEILSTGGTAGLLRKAGLTVTDVSTHTGSPEILDGRVKTLHPKIHGGILARRDLDSHAQQMAEHDIAPIDMVVVNLYPFQQTIAAPNCLLSDAIENIDIGGPTMVRAAAKNHASVAIVVHTEDYPNILAEMQANANALSDQRRFQLAAKAFVHTAQYDAAIAQYLSAVDSPEANAEYPSNISLTFNKVQDLRYGENPHQSAAFYVEDQPAEASISSAQQLLGKELSYNNIADADAALECVKAFSEQPACVIVKHANPCGVAFGKNLVTAYDRAYETDSVSAFGGIIAFNRTLDRSTAQAILDQQFVEVIIAPAVADGVEDIIASKKNVRLLVCGEFGSESRARRDYKRVNGGLLVQDADLELIKGEPVVVTKRQPTEQEFKDLNFAWRVAKYVKSNAIVYCKNGQTIGVGAGQMSRVDSAKIAASKAQDAELEVAGSVMASDAFFPFRDGLDQAGGVGVTAVIQPGGSIRDDEVIAAADEHNIAMVFTSMRHFRH